MKRVNVAKFQGVYYRDSEKRRYQGKPDRCYDICYRDRNGKLTWEKVGWASEGYSAAMAANVRAERVRTVRHGEELPGKKKEVTFGEAWEKFYEWSQSNRVSHNDDLSRYNKHLKGLLADMTLSSISPFLLEKVKSAMAREGKSPQTIKHVLALARQVYNMAGKWGDYDGENPLAQVQKPSTAHTNRQRFLSRPEAHLLLEELKMHSHQLYEIALVSLHTGMRAGEIFNLTWGDILLDQGVINVLGSMNRGTKNKKYRHAYMTKELKDLFGSRDRGEPKAYVFTTREGNKIKDVSHTFEEVVSRLGFNDGVEDRRQKIVFHSLRHTFGSWLAMAGTHPQEIMELMGHGRIEQTMRYSHLAPNRKREVIEGLKDIFAIPESSAVELIAKSKDDAEMLDVK